MGKLLLYSCLGLLTLQIGVAVLSALYFILAFLTIICNFVDVHVEPDTPPVNYILLGVFVVLLILTALLMFITAYKENKKLCTISVVLMVVIFIIFVITSIISFVNQPKLTKYVCMSDGHCPESLWLAGFRYRAIQDEPMDDNSTTFTTQTPMNNTKSQNRYLYFGKNLRNRGLEEDWENRDMEEDLTYFKNYDGPKRKLHVKGSEEKPDYINPTPNNSTNLQKKYYYGKNLRNRGLEEDLGNRDIEEDPILLKNYNGPKRNSTVKGSVEIPDSNHSFPIQNSSVNNGYNKDLKLTDYLKIIKRSLSSMGRYSREDPNEPMEFIFQRRNSRVANSESTTQQEIMEIEEETDTGSEYVVGPDLFMAVILFLVICAFFIFTILVLWSYKTQLKYIHLYALHPESQPQIT